MTPVSLNSPTPSFLLTDQIEDRAQLFITSPNNLDSTNSLSCPSFFNLHDQTQSREIGALRHDQEDEVVLHVGSSSDRIRNLSLISPEPVKDDPSNLCGYDSSVICETEEEERRSGSESPKWMSSKMRLMRKMMRSTHNPNRGVTHRLSDVTAPTLNQNLEHENRQASPHIPISHRNSTIKVCADCNTTSTPLWRGGPKGPKSLCNACGIRQRKARRALMEEAANGHATSSTSSSRAHNKEKKRRTDHLLQLKNTSKSTSTARAATSHDHPEPHTNNFGLVDQFQVFPRDEVAQAALLLMDLSCGFLPI